MRLSTNEQRYIYELEQKQRLLDGGLDASDNDNLAGEPAIQDPSQTETAEQDAETPSTIQQGAGLRWVQLCIVFPSVLTLCNTVS